MDRSYRLVTSHRRNDERCAIVDAGIDAYNDSRVPAFAEARKRENWEPLHVFLEDSAGTVLGGVTGRLHRGWGWLHVQDLWVDERLRGHQYGRALMCRIEETARGVGCQHVDLRTSDFQAPGFYQKLGYRIVGQLDHFPEGHVYYWFRKDFGSPL